MNLVCHFGVHKVNPYQKSLVQGQIVHLQLSHVCGGSFVALLLHFSSMFVPNAICAFCSSGDNIVMAGY